MRLTEEEAAMLAGEHGPARQWAIEHQLAVGGFFGARDLVPVSQAHVMADTESLGEAGILWLEGWAALSEPLRRVRVPTTSDPRGTDFAASARLRHAPWMLDRERRAAAALKALGVLMTDSCIIYQTVIPPVMGEHAAYGDTGVVIYANSVQGARSNFEGGPSALAAAFSGRTPRYGYHLEERRRPSLRIDLDWTPRDWSDWGALGGVVGRLAGDYWAVPLVCGLDRAPGSDELKHFGAAAASHGSLALCHIAGVTPEAQHIRNSGKLPSHRIGEAEIRAFRAQYGGREEGADVVVFAAPQLSLLEMRQLADQLDGRRTRIPLFAITSPQVKPDADRLGLSRRIEAAGGTVLSGMCFYNSYAREMAAANGWRRLASNSAKLVNILGGYGYRPVLLSMAECVELACNG